MASKFESILWPAVAAVREKRPLIICLTNFVSMDVMANGLLALGASPAMVHSRDELSEAVAFCRQGGAVSINIGTLDTHWVECFKEAVSCCKQMAVPWVLDPVGAGFTSFRTRTAKELIAIHPPAVIRGNASEIMALAGDLGVVGKGVDSSSESTAAVDAAKALAQKYGCTVCVSGKVDFIVNAGDSPAVASCPHGVEMLTKVTAMGCLVSSVIAAFVAARPEGLDVQAATTAAMTFFNISAELAAKQSCGPGSFRSAFLDRLHDTDAVTWAHDGERPIETRYDGQ